MKSGGVPERQEAQNASLFKYKLDNHTSRMWLPAGLVNESDSTQGSHDGNHCGAPAIKKLDQTQDLTKPKPAAIASQTNAPAPAAWQW